MSKKSMFSVFKNRMLPKQIRQQRAKLGVEQMDNRINPALVLVNDPANGILNGLHFTALPGGGTQMCVLFAADNDTNHQIQVFDDAIFTGGGLRVTGSDGAGNKWSYFLDDSTYGSQATFFGAQYKGVEIDLDYLGNGKGNDVIDASPGAVIQAPTPPPSGIVITNGLGYTNPVQHTLCLADGGAGNDSICGGNGNDSILGGSGNDVLVGGPGRDTMQGQDGYDCVVADNADLFAGSTSANVGGGTGGPNLTGFAAGDLMPALDSKGNDVAQPGRYAQADQLLIVDGSGKSSATPSAATVYNNSDFEVIVGGTGADNIISNNGVRRGVEMYGNNGNDYLESISAGSATSGRDTIYGGAGNDTLVGGPGNDLIHGDAVPGAAPETTADCPFPTLTPTCLTATTCPGNILQTTLGNLIGGGVGGTSFTAGSGNDSLVGGTGDDTLQGASGNDNFNGGAGADTFCDTAGNDTVNYCDSPAGVTVILGNISPAVVSSSVFAGGDAQGDSTPNPTAIENVWGSNFNDFIQGNNVANFLDGFGGDDTMFGVEGDDTMEGGAGNDYMYGDNGNDVMKGQEGNDSMEGGNGNDSMFGGSGDDVLEGQRGNDCLNGGTGSDTADGGLGNDSFILDWGNGQNPTSLQNALANPGPFLNKTLSATAGNDPLNGGDMYFGGAGRDTFQVYGAWIEINANTANARLVADNGRVNDITNYLSNQSNVGFSDFNTSGSLNNTDVVLFNTDFNTSPLATSASQPSDPGGSFEAGIPNGNNRCRHIEGLSICGPDPIVPAGQPTAQPPAP